MLLADRARGHDAVAEGSEKFSNRGIDGFGAFALANVVVH
jgi:hypothetical protein